MLVSIRGWPLRTGIGALLCAAAVATVLVVTSRSDGGEGPTGSSAAQTPNADAAGQPGRATFSGVQGTIVVTNDTGQRASTLFLAIFGEHSPSALGGYSLDASVVVNAPGCAPVLSSWWRPLKVTWPDRCVAPGVLVTLSLGKVISWSAHRQPLVGPAVHAWASTLRQALRRGH